MNLPTLDAFQLMVCTATSRAEVWRIIGYFMLKELLEKFLVSGIKQAGVAYFLFTWKFASRWCPQQIIPL